MLLVEFSFFFISHFCINCPHLVLDVFVFGVTHRGGGGGAIKEKPGVEAADTGGA